LNGTFSLEAVNAFLSDDECPLLLPVELVEFLNLAREEYAL